MGEVWATLVLRVTLKLDVVSILVVLASVEVAVEEAEVEMSVGVSVAADSALVAVSDDCVASLVSGLVEVPGLFVMKTPPKFLDDEDVDIDVDSSSSSAVSVLEGCSVDWSAIVGLDVGVGVGVGDEADSELSSSVEVGEDSWLVLSSMLACAVSSSCTDVLVGVGDGSGLEVEESSFSPAAALEEVGRRPITSEKSADSVVGAGEGDGSGVGADVGLTDGSAEDCDCPSGPTDPLRVKAIGEFQTSSLDGSEASGSRVPGGKRLPLPPLALARMLLEISTLYLEGSRTR